MAQQAANARTPGAKRAGDGEYVFDLAKVNHILGGPDYSTANGACVEGDRMIVGLMRSEEHTSELQSRLGISYAVSLDRKSVV